jgi:hypothetical protein
VFRGAATCCFGLLRVVMNPKAHQKSDQQARGKHQAGWLPQTHACAIGAQLHLLKKARQVASRLIFCRSQLRAVLLITPRHQCTGIHHFLQECSVQGL